MTKQQELRLRTSIHEAAHALAVLAGGSVPSEVVLDADGAGHVRYNQTALDADANALVAHAGGAAVGVLMGSGHAAKPSRADYDTLERSAMNSHLPPGPLSKRADREAGSFAWTHRYAINALSDALMSNGRLDAEDVKRLVHSHVALYRFRSTCPKPTPRKAPAKSCTCVATGGGCSASMLATTPKSWPAGRREFIAKNPHMRATIDQMIARGHLSR